MKIKIAVLVLFGFGNMVFAQQNENKFEPGGKVTGQVFLNYHYDLTKDVEKKSQFEILRSSFGYLYNFSEKLSSKIVFDASNDGKSFSAFLKNASLEWRMNRILVLEGGMIHTNTFDTQEDFYRYRYVMESFQDKEKFYTSFDLGFRASFKPSDILELRLGVFNGEGFKKIQDDFGVHKTSFDLIIHPVKELTFKAYYDFMPKRDTSILNADLLYTQNTVNFFAGYEQKDHFRFGIEYNMQNNNGNRKNFQLNGISAYGTYIIKKIELFARYDQLSSNTLYEDINPWNISKNYRMVLGGIQLSPAKGVKTALNFRHYIPQNPGSVPINVVYINLEFKF